MVKLVKIHTFHLHSAFLTACFFLAKKNKVDLINQFRDTLDHLCSINKHPHMNIGQQSEIG